VGRGLRKDRIGGLGVTWRINMKLVIEYFCVRCGICIDTAPDLFERDDANDVMVVKFDDIPDSFKGAAMQAAESCAVSAILVIE
jgi:ferredoxin